MYIKIEKARVSQFMNSVEAAVISITIGWTPNKQSVTMLVSGALLGSPYRTDIEGGRRIQLEDRQAD